MTSAMTQYVKSKQRVVREAESRYGGNIGEIITQRKGAGSVTKSHTVIPKVSQHYFTLNKITFNLKLKSFYLKEKQRYVHNSKKRLRTSLIKTRNWKTFD